MPRYQRLKRYPIHYRCQVVYRFAGRDASAEYNQVHSPSLIRKSLGPGCCIGLLDESTITDNWQRTEPAGTKGRRAADPDTIPPLEAILNLDGFERAANEALSAKSWAFIHSGSNDSITRDANNAFLRKIWFRPVIVRDVG